MGDLSFRIMTDEDFAEYKSWYGTGTPESKMLERYLEPPTKKWISFVKSANDAHAWAVLRDDKMVAHIQQDDWDPNDVTVAIAVKPGLGGQGIATAAMRQFIKEHLSTKTKILAHIEADNEASLRTFRKLRFHQTMAEPDKENLITFCYDIPKQRPLSLPSAGR